MTLDQIAKELGYTQTRLRQRRPKGVTPAQRRQFAADAFALTHDLGAIAEYLSLKPQTIKHALRMHCMETFGGPYDRSVEEMRELMGERV